MIILSHTLAALGLLLPNPPPLPAVAGSSTGRTGVQGVHALDTGCVWGGRMTLMNLDTHELHHCDCAT